MEVNKTYSPSDIEKKWYAHWQEHGYFKPAGDPDKKPYVIFIPPPNITGILHMGHVLNNTVQDVLIRFHRLLGEPTLWLPGTDHAGIATQNVVEKVLAKEGTNRHEVGREELIKRIWAWKEDKGGHIIEQLKQLGASCDWDRLRFTMDEGLSRAVREVFVRLYEKGLIYKGKYIINWCPRCVTALANDEVEHEDEDGHLWHIRYPFADGDGEVIIATTRPETMFGDTAVAVHPQDDRYAHMVGRQLVLPLTGRTIPLLADEYVEREFGSGCVKITPAHDPNDFEVGRRHNLEQLVVMDEHGVMNENAPAEFHGLPREEARKKAIKMLEEQGLLVKVDAHRHAVGRCYRCNTVIEPYLSDQWFVKMKPLAEPAIQYAKDGTVTIAPQRWYKVYLHWLENVRDWCISRQIWWGHRIPAYYCQDCGQMMVSRDLPDKCSSCGSGNLQQDEDVLDTWFSSWLWPFSTLGWPDKTEDLQRFLPGSVLVTESGILYLWVARMVMATQEFCGKIPFDQIYLHGKVLDEKGRKMSKSLGNSPDPIDIINTVGADALRFSMIFHSPKGADVMYSDACLEQGRNFANKIWNAYRYVMMNAKVFNGPRPELTELADRWIYARLNHTIREMADDYQNIRLNEAASAIMTFLWDDYCSWYLELTKERIYGPEGQERDTALYCLLDVLQQAMHLLHPLMPFISEEIYQTLRQYLPLTAPALIIGNWPTVDESLLDEAMESDMGFIQDSITVVRNLRKENNIAPGAEVRLVVTGADEAYGNVLNRYQSYFRKLAKVSEWDFAAHAPKPFLAGSVSVVKYCLPLDGLDGLDAGEIIAKLQKRQEKMEQEIVRLQAKLGNAGFVDRAPAEVVETEKAKLADVENKLQKTAEIISGLV